MPAKILFIAKKQAAMLFVSFAFALLNLVSVVQSTNWYQTYWCGHGLQYLDDSKCAKKFPANFNREWTCPVALEKTVPENFFPEGDFSQVKVDTTSLAKYVTDSSINLCIAVTKRVADDSEQGYSLYNRYFCAGDKSATEGYETWSSSKIFAMANAAGHLRTNETKCGSGDAHNQLFGLDGTVNGKHGVTPFGDLATVVCSYDSTAGYSSNSLSSYFHDIGWRDRINYLLQDWLKVSNQTLGGNYGESTPTDLGFVATETEDGAKSTCSIDKDPWPKKYDNTISALTEVELTRRIPLHRELPADKRFPGSSWVDMKNILYGAESSLLFPSLQWGGMTADTAIFLQSTDYMKTLLADSASHQNQWRIFSKLGAGYSSSRSRGEIVSNAYTCVPKFDETGKEAIGGYEFTISGRGSIPNDYSLVKVEAKLMDAFNQALNFLKDTFP